MAWEKFAKNVVKGAVAAFVVGAVLALLAPPIASMVGVSLAEIGISSNPLWLGAFFGAWGGLAAAAAPVMDYIFGDTKHEEEKVQHKPQASTLTIELSPEQSQEISGALGNFQDRVKQGRVEPDYNRLM